VESSIVLPTDTILRSQTQSIKQNILLHSARLSGRGKVQRHQRVRYHLRVPSDLRRVDSRLVAESVQRVAEGNRAGRVQGGLQRNRFMPQR
jgi:hypothetical protein